MIHCPVCQSEIISERKDASGKSVYRCHGCEHTWKTIRSAA